MTRYEIPELFKVGSVEGVVLGPKHIILTDDTDGSPEWSRVASSVIDVD